MNGPVFEKWVETQLIVGLRTLGQCVIVMDNASYHSRLVENQPTTKWRKEQLLSWLRQNGVSPPENATRVELQRLCIIHRNSLKRYVVDEMLQNEGHIVIRLPPYHSFFNPIELVWSVSKHYYNKTVVSRPGQGLDRAKFVWKEALSKVTKEIWSNEVKHTEKKIMQYFNEEVKDVPEIQEFIINHADSSDSEDDAEEEEALATPLDN
ncbi:uncharacterized protein [Periplaneta americana]|uniref:uncharacterized protein n=1 Tax=Periplaneta americana TaxID=6978 RepID=UPI0037E7063D